MKSDADIQKDVIEQLKWEPILNAAEIGVAVKNGIVTLSGIVDTISKKIAAEAATKKVTGVRAVAEDIQVGISPSFRRTDTEIAEAALNIFRWNTAIPENKIRIKVEDGIVNLEGEVDWYYQRNAAMSAMEKLAGIRKINNFITVGPAVMVGDVRNKITAALHRSATIDAGKINVIVSGSKVTLSGKVRSFAEQEDAVNAAWAAPGVINVENRMEIQEEEFAFTD